jgi:hypothetical protein
VGTKKFCRAVFCLWVFSAQGCVKIGEREPVHQDQVIRTEEVEQPIKGVFAELKPQGTRISITATKACDVINNRVVNRTTVVENYNEEPGKTWLLAGTGVAAMGIGAGMAAGVIQTQEDPKDAHKDKGFGILLSAGGVAMVTASIIDAVRASGSTETSEGEVAVPGATLKRGVPCDVHPAGNETVEGNLDGEIITLGTTDPLGRIQVDLHAAIPGYLVIEPTQTLKLSVGGEAAGAVDLKPVAALRASQAFSQLHLDWCTSPKTANACDPLRGFLRDYPDVPQAAEVLAALEIGEPLTNAIDDDDSWAEVQASGCGNPEIKEPQEVLTACEAAITYRKVYTNGRHISEVTKLLDQAHARGEKTMDARERAQKAEAAKEAAAERAKCVGQCKVICSSWRFKDQSSCMEGCLQSQCSESVR